MNPAQRRNVLSSGLTAIMLIAGCGALLLGGLLAVGAGMALRESQANPDFMWGPDAYVFQVLKECVYLALVLVPAGVVLVMVGWRRVRRVRGAADRMLNGGEQAHAEA